MSTKLEWKETVLNGHKMFTSVTPAETKELRKLANDKFVIEIGSGYGYSAIAMAATAKHVLAIDPHQGELRDSLPDMQANLALHTVGERVSIVLAQSQTILPVLYCMGIEPGFVFVDGNHDEQVANDVEYAFKLVGHGGYVAVHDYAQYDFPEITRVCDKYNVTRVVDSLWVGQYA